MEIALRFESRSQNDVLNIPVVEVPYAICGPADSELEPFPWLGFREDRIHTEPEIVRTLHIQVLTEIQRLKRVEIFLQWLTKTLKTTVP